MPPRAGPARSTSTCPATSWARRWTRASVTYPGPARPTPRSLGDPAAVKEAVALLAKAERPLVLGGSGVWWSDAAAAFQAFVEATGMPFYTTPLSRGTVPEDHPLAFLNARAKAFGEADVILSIGTRFNYVVQFWKAPRFAADLKVIQVDVNPTELGHNRPVDVPIAGDARAVLQQLAAEAKGKIDPARYKAWTSRLRSIDDDKQLEMNKAMSQRPGADPPAPALQGSEGLHAARRHPRRRRPGDPELRPPVHPHLRARPSAELRSVRHAWAWACRSPSARRWPGPTRRWWCCTATAPTASMATRSTRAVRHNIPVLAVISNNGGWTADPEQNKPGRNLGYTRWDKVAMAVGAHGEHVEKPDEIRPALERAWASGKPAVVNVVTDYKARATTVRFSAYST